MAMSVVRSKSFPNNPSNCKTRIINLLCNVVICKSTNIHENQNKSYFTSSSLLASKSALVLLVTFIMTVMMTGPCDCVPVTVRPTMRPSSVINGNPNSSGSRFISSYNLSPSAGPASSGSAPSSTLQNLHALESGSSLSIVSPLDILRQNMVMEILRRKHRLSKQRQVQLNKEILDRIG